MMNVVSVMVMEFQEINVIVQDIMKIVTEFVVVTLELMSVVSVMDPEYMILTAIVLEM